MVAYVIQDICDGILEGELKSVNLDKSAIIGVHGKSYLFFDGEWWSDPAQAIKAAKEHRDNLIDDLEKEVKELVKIDFSIAKIKKAYI